MSAISEAAIVTPRQSVGRAVAAATVGNMLEWYDFTIYAAFAVAISKNFFPADSEIVSLLLSFVTFGLGFVARPFGAAILGGYADRRGRRNALGVTIILMALGTGIIAVCPTYERIGLAAPLIIILGRLIQGFSAGGEIGGAVSTLVEHAPPNRRALYGSYQQLSQGGSTLLASLVAIILSLALSPAQIGDWGWRVAFAVGLLIAPVGLYIRRQIEDAAVFTEKAAASADRQPAWLVFRDHWRTVLAGMLMVMLWTVAQYIASYFPTFAVRELKVSLSTSYVGPFVVGSVLLFCPIVGLLADRFGRKTVMAVGALGLLVSAYPAFAFLIASPTPAHVVETQFVIAFFMLIYTAPASAVLAELFPTRVRATGIALTYSFGVAIFGGFTPAIITALISWTAASVSIAYYLMGAALVSLIAVLTLSDKTGKTLS